MSFRHSARRNDRQDDTMAKQLFNGFVRKTEQFRTKLEVDIKKNIREFCPTDAEMIHYTERWLAEVRTDRRIGGGWRGYIDEKTTDVCGGDDIPATESEMRYKMLNFLEEGRGLTEMFEQIDNYENPVLFEDEEKARCLDYPFSDCQIAIYQKDIMKVMGITDDIRGGDGGAMFVFRVVNELVEEWMLKEVKEYIVRGHAI